MLAKIRNLWRFDGDAEPVRVSRRAFFFVGGVVAAGAAVPESVNHILAMVSGMTQSYDLTRSDYTLIRVMGPLSVSTPNCNEMLLRRIKWMEFMKGSQWDHFPANDVVSLDEILGDIGA